MAEACTKSLVLFFIYKKKQKKKKALSLTHDVVDRGRGPNDWKAAVLFLVTTEAVLQNVFQKWANPGLFCLFSSFSHYTI